MSRPNVKAHCPARVTTLGVGQAGRKRVKDDVRDLEIERRKLQDWVNTQQEQPQQQQMIPVHAHTARAPASSSLLDLGQSISSSCSLPDIKRHHRRHQYPHSHNHNQHDIEGEHERLLSDDQELKVQLQNVKHLQAHEIKREALLLSSAAAAANGTSLCGSPKNVTFHHQPTPPSPSLDTKAIKESRMNPFVHHYQEGDSGDNGDVMVSELAAGAQVGLRSNENDVAHGWGGGKRCIPHPSPSVSPQHVPVGLMYPHQPKAPSPTSTTPRTQQHIPLQLPCIRTQGLSR